jgi:hypothetical protein
MTTEILCNLLRHSEVFWWVTVSRLRQKSPRR